VESVAHLVEVRRGKKPIMRAYPFTWNPGSECKFCRSTIEGTALDLSVLETLKASGDALKHLGATGPGLRAVEEIVADVENNMQHAAEITSVLSSGSVTGMVNSMSIHGTVLDEDELMRELELMDAELGSFDKDPQSSFAAPSAVSGSTAIKSILAMPSIPEEGMSELAAREGSSSLQLLSDRGAEAQKWRLPVAV